MAEYAPSSAVLDLIMEREGFAAEPYRCPAGKLTIGYGHVIRRGETFEVPMTKDAARDLLEQDLSQYAAAVRRLVTRPLRWYEMDALVSFTFNVGIGAFSTSTLLKKVNAGQPVREEFRKWRWATVAKLDDAFKPVRDEHGDPVTVKKELHGLKTRREREADLYEGIGVPR